MLASGAGALYMADRYGWHVTYMFMACLMAVGIFTTLVGPEPAASAAVAKAKASAREWLLEYVVAPLRDFTLRRGWIALLLFIVLYKLGDALLGVMTNPFLLELGFTKTQIAQIVKLYGFAATLIGIWAGGMIV